MAEEPFDDGIDDLIEDPLHSGDPFVRALRAPGSTSELAHEQVFRDAFRAAQGSRGGAVRRFVGRAGVGATAALTTVVLTAGVAAAYGRVLPDPVQQAVHEVLGPVGVPAPEKQPQRDRSVAPPAATPERTPEATPTRTVSAPPTARPSPKPGTDTSPTAPGTPTGTATPGEPSPTATTSALPAQPEPVPAALSVRTSASTVPLGATVTVSGVLTDAEGAPVRGRVVRLLARTATEGWTKVGQGRTDRKGRVSVQTPALERSTAVRLRVRAHVRSPVVRVVVRPVLEARVSEEAGTSTVTVTARGSQAGDSVTVFRWKSGRLVKIATVALGADGTATYTTPTPRRAVRVVVRLPASKHHGQAQTAATLGKRSS